MNNELAVTSYNDREITQANLFERDIINPEAIALHTEKVRTCLTEISQQEELPEYVMSLLTLGQNYQDALYEARVSNGTDNERVALALLKQQISEIQEHPIVSTFTKHLGVSGTETALSMMKVLIESMTKDDPNNAISLLAYMNGDVKEIPESVIQYIQSFGEIVTNLVHTVTRGNNSSNDPSFNNGHYHSRSMQNIVMNFLSIAVTTSLIANVLSGCSIQDTTKTDDLYGPETTDQITSLMGFDELFDIIYDKIAQLQAEKAESVTSSPEVIETTTAILNPLLDSTKIDYGYFKDNAELTVPYEIVWTNLYKNAIPLEQNTSGLIFMTDNHTISSKVFYEREYPYNLDVSETYGRYDTLNPDSVYIVWEVGEKSDHELIVYEIGGVQEAMPRSLALLFLYLQDPSIDEHGLYTNHFRALGFKDFDPNNQSQSVEATNLLQQVTKEYLNGNIFGIIKTLHTHLSQVHPELDSRTIAYLVAEAIEKLSRNPYGPIDGPSSETKISKIHGDIEESFESMMEKHRAQLEMKDRKNRLTEIIKKDFWSLYYSWFYKPIDPRP